MLPAGFALPDDPTRVTGEIPADVRAVLAAAADDDQLWDGWRETQVDLVLPPSRRPARVEPVDGPREFPPGHDLLHVLTSCNPAGVAHAVADNIRRLAVLRGLLELRDVPHWPATGHDAENTWQEPGFLVAGLTDQAARELGAAMGQVAIFAWTPRSWAILACVTDRRVELPWSVRRLA